MRHAVIAALVLALSGSWAGAQQGKQPKEINAKGWLNTGPLSLAQLRGKVVVVEFWATWCGPCVKSIPHLIEMRNKFDKSQVEIIGLTDEPLNKIETFTKDMKMNYAVGYGSTTGRDYNVKGIPHAVVVGPDGLTKWEGHPAEPEFDKTVAKLAATVRPARAPAPEPKPALGDALAAALKAPATPPDLKISWSRTEGGKKAPKEFSLTGDAFELRTENDEKKSGTVEGKETADLLKALVDAQVATKDVKPPAKEVVKLAVSLGAESRELTFDPGKGYGAFAKALKMVEDLHAKYSK